LVRGEIRKIYPGNVSCFSFTMILSPRACLISKALNIKLYQTVDLSFILCGRATG
jgi:hypothetical protein